MRTLVVFLGFLMYATACESTRLPACEAGLDADMIFIGTSLGLNKAGGGYTFRIDEPLRGIGKETKEVTVGSAACSDGYEPGEKFLIVVNKVDVDGRTYFPSIPYSLDDSIETTEALALFRTLARGGHESLIYGRVAENTDDRSVNYGLDNGDARSLSGVELAITDNKTKVRFTRVSDGRGSYSLRVPEAGDYSVTAKLAGHSSSENAYDFKLPADGCKELNVGMWTASRLTGHITIPDNKPASNLTVELQPADENRSHPASLKTDANGRFEFEKIPPGEYVVGINTLGVSSKLPLEPSFYPGVRTKAAAQVVKITGAQTIENLDFKIGPRKPTRSITISVQWPDGRPVINASVMCVGTRIPAPEEEKDYVSRWVDPEGEATCEVLADQEYQVEADHLSWEHSLHPVQPIATRAKVTVPAGTFPVHVKLVIDSVNDSRTDKPENMAEYNDREF